MASQMSITSRNPRLRRNQIAELNARLSRLPGILANQQRMEDIAREREFFEKEYALDQKLLGFQKDAARKSRRQAQRASEVGMGLEIGKTGTTIATSFGGTTTGNIVDKTRSLFGVAPTAPTTTSGRLLSNISVGSVLGGALAGYGAGRILGKDKSKAKKGLIGAGIGFGLGLLGGGDLSSGISGGISGGIGGLFS